MNGLNSPIGVFDSGVGGLAVLWELHRFLPAEDLLYFADQAHFPYGKRTKEDVRGLAVAAAEFLASHDSKLIVVACNTASSAALTELRRRFPIPIVGIEPAVKPACSLTRCGKIGILATSGTVQGDRLRELIDRVSGEVEVFSAPAGGLVDLVESGGASSSDASAMLEEALAPLRCVGVDVVVLGCTHYAFLKEAVQSFMGPGVTVLEPAEAVARHAVSVLHEHGLLAHSERRGRITYSSSAGEAHIRASVAMLRSGGASISTVAAGYAGATAASGGAD